MGAGNIEGDIRIFRWFDTLISTHQGYKTAYTYNADEDLWYKVKEHPSKGVNNLSWLS